MAAGQRCPPVIQVRWRQEDQEIRVILCYIVNLRNSLGYKTSCLKTNQMRHGLVSRTALIVITVPAPETA